MRAGHPQLRELERAFWAEIDALDPGIDRVEFRRRVLGLVFLRFLDESFSDRRAWLERESRDARSVYFSLDLEREQLLSRPDAYHAASVAFIPLAARWERLQRAAAASTIGNLGRAVDAILISVVKGNPRLEGVFPDDYSRPELDRAALARAILAVSRLDVPPSATPPPGFPADALGTEEVRSTADALAFICQAFLFEASSSGATPGPNRLRTRTPPPIAAPEYTSAIARLDHQLTELARILGRRPNLRSPREGNETD